MTYLFLHIVFNTSFGLLFKLNRMSGRQMFGAGAVNYLVASAVGLIGYLIGGAGTQPAQQTVGIGVIAGLSYLSCFALMDVNVHRVGISITWATIRVSVVLSVILSVLLWGERPTGLQVVGAALALAALPLLSMRRNNGAKGSLWGVGTLLILGQFLCGAGNSITVKWFSEAGPSGQRQLFLAFLFGTAAIGCLVIMAARRARFHALDVPYGAVIGICNLLGSHYLLRALGELPGVIVFPVATAASIVLATLVGVGVWREPLSRPGVAGLVLAVASVLLVNSTSG